MANNQTSQVYKVLCTTTTISEVLVKASSKREAISISQDNGLFSEAKEEIIDTIYDTEIIGNHPKGRIVHTIDGYIDADKQHHAF